MSDSISSFIRHRNCLGSSEGSMTHLKQIVQNTIACCLAAGLVLVAGIASAQQPPGHSPSSRPAPSARPTQPAPSGQQPQAAGGDETPQRTTATYDDWVVQCQSQSGTPSEKVCDMAQMTQVQGKNIPFSRVAILRPVKGQPIKLIAQLPVNVSFAANVRIQLSDTDSGLAAPFARCVPAGCFAEFDIKDDVLQKLRVASGAGKLSFADSTGHDVTVPVSFKGFGQAFDALAKE
jgi:invasion protein IalB